MTSSVYFCYNQEAAVPNFKFEDDTTCGRLKTAPRRCPGNYGCYFMWKWDLCRCDLVEDLDLGLSWIIRGRELEVFNRYPNKREAERDLTQTGKEKVIENGGRV